MSGRRSPLSRLLTCSCYLISRVFTVTTMHFLRKSIYRIAKRDIYSLCLLAKVNWSDFGVTYDDDDEVHTYKDLSDLRSRHSIHIDDYCMVLFASSPLSQSTNSSAILCHFQHNSVSCLVNTRRKQGHSHSQCSANLHHVDHLAYTIDK